MKTKIVTPVFLMVSLLTVIFFSCAKDDKAIFIGSTNPNQPENQLSSGSIEDVGLINSDVRQMNVAMRNATVQLKNPTLETVLLVGNFQVAFHSVEDGLIPIGDYVFSDAFNGAPFTFHSASVQMSGVEEGTYSSLEIVGGVIRVLQNDPEYEFQYNCLLITGDSIQGSFNGRMNYTDNH
jgi:hypothetical protein